MPAPYALSADNGLRSHMDEGPGPRGGSSRAHPGDQTPQRVGVHRLNDLMFGHVGQVSYKPIDDDDEADIGDLSLSRATEHLPSCQQVIPLGACLPPTRARAGLQPSTAFQRTRSQKNWLLKTHPEAFLGVLDLPALIFEESRADASSHGQDGPAGSVLAVGEIVDLRHLTSSRISAWPVVATASGEAGHMLRLCAIEPERWTWNQSALPVGMPQSMFQGSWCSDGSPILQIQFATRYKQYDTIRWLLVQKSTSVTIFEPEIRARPVAAVSSGLGHESATTGHIAMNPIVTLNTSATGGESHCDFAIDMGSDTEAPQLSIIDRSGNWSVWYILREGNGRSRTTRAVLRRRGTLNLPPSASPQHEQQMLDDTRRIVWVSRSVSADEWDRERSPSAESDEGLPKLHTAYLAGLSTSPRKYDGLLLCNSTEVRLVDVVGEHLISGLVFSSRHHKDALLDTQPFPGSPFYCLVLTTDRIYLLDVSQTERQEGHPLRVLTSCRHHRSQQWESLKMSVVKTPSLPEAEACLVFLHSTVDLRVDVFWFTITQQDGDAHFHHQLLHLPDLQKKDTEDSQGIQSLAVVPLALSATRGQKRTGTTDNHPSAARADEVQFYQLFMLTKDLGLNSLIIAITHGASQKVARPSRSAKSSWDAARRSRFLRLKFLREVDQAFVVPEPPEQDKQLSAAPKPSPAEKHDALQLRFYLLELIQEINDACFGRAAEEPAEADVIKPFSLICEALHGLDDDSHISLRPLSSCLDVWQPLELPQVEDEWALTLRKLQKSPRIRLSHCGVYIPSGTVMDVFERISINWSCRLPAESLKASQWGYMEKALEKMAAEVYMSERGVSVVPQCTLDMAARSLPRDEDTRVQSEDWMDELPSSQPRSSQTLPTPSATPSSSRAASEAVDSAKHEKDQEGAGQEDAAVVRLRMYLPSIKFTPPPKSGPSRVLSLWPEQRGSDPSEYQYKRFRKGPDEKAEAAKREREKQEERRRRKAERKAQLGIKTEGGGESLSQPLPPTIIRSSPPPQDVGSSSHVIGFGFGSQSQSQGSGFSQTMSQPVAGEFGARSSRFKKKGKAKVKVQPKAARGFR